MDDEPLMSIDNTGKWMQSQFKGEEYAIPSGMLEGKSHVRVKFQAQQGASVGGIYDLRLLKRPESGLDLSERLFRSVEGAEP